MHQQNPLGLSQGTLATLQRANGGAQPQAPAATAVVAGADKATVPILAPAGSRSAPAPAPARPQARVCFSREQLQVFCDALCGLGVFLLLSLGAVLLLLEVLGLGPGSTGTLLLRLCAYIGGSAAGSLLLGDVGTLGRVVALPLVCAAVLCDAVAMLAACCKCRVPSDAEWQEARARAQLQRMTLPQFKALCVVAFPFACVLAYVIGGVAMAGLLGAFVGLPRPKQQMVDVGCSKGGGGRTGRAWLRHEWRHCGGGQAGALMGGLLTPWYGDIGLDHADDDGDDLERGEFHMSGGSVAAGRQFMFVSLSCALARFVPALLAALPVWDGEDNKRHVLAAYVWHAAKHGREGRVRELAALGAGVDTPDARHSTAMWIAAAGGHVGAIRALAELGAGVNTPTTDGMTPVFAAASCGHSGAVQALAQLGAGVTVPDSSGVTPAGIAAQKGHADVAQALAPHTVV